MEQTQKYQAIVGETGNEQGHVVGVYTSEDAAERAARRAVRKYQGDGWYRVRRI